jgi:hypothetical protein
MLSLKTLCSIKIVVLTKERRNLQLLPLPILLKNQLFESAVELFDKYLQFYPCHVCLPDHSEFRCKYRREVRDMLLKPAYIELWDISILKNFRLSDPYIQCDNQYLEFLFYQYDTQRICKICYDNSKKWKLDILWRELTADLIKDAHSYCSNCYLRVLFKIRPNWF